MDNAESRLLCYQRIRVDIVAEQNGLFAIDTVIKALDCVATCKRRFVVQQNIGLEIKRIYAPSDLFTALDGSKFSVHGVEQSDEILFGRCGFEVGVCRRINSFEVALVELLVEFGNSPLGRCLSFSCAASGKHQRRHGENSAEDCEWLGVHWF